MTDQTTPETGKEQPSQELPIPKLETASSVGPTSSVDVDAIVKQVTEKIQNDLRMAQSTKDKEIAKIKKQLGISDLSELEEMGAQIPDNVKLEYRLRQIEGQRTPTENSPTQQPSSPGNGAALSAQDVSEAVKNYQLDANAPEVIDALRGTYRNRDHFEATLAKLALAKTTKPTGSAAESTTISSTSTTVKEDVNVMITKLQELQQEPTKNRVAIKELKQKLDARDWR